MLSETIRVALIFSEAFVLLVGGKQKKANHQALVKPFNYQL